MERRRIRSWFCFAHHEGCSFVPFGERGVEPLIRLILTPSKNEGFSSPVFTGEVSRRDGGGFQTSKQPPQSNPLARLLTAPPQAGEQSDGGLSLFTPTLSLPEKGSPAITVHLFRFIPASS